MTTTRCCQFLPFFQFVSLDFRMHLIRILVNYTVAKQEQVGLSKYHCQ